MKDKVSTAEGPCVSLIASRLRLAPALVISMVKKRLVIKSARAPRRVPRGGGAEGERMDHGW